MDVYIFLIIAIKFRCQANEWDGVSVGFLKINLC